MTAAFALLAWVAWSVSWHFHERRVRRRYAESRLARLGSESIS